ncbi:hypothetical protein AB0J86_13220 [Micromonospora sp. NPDC049559]|uniref:aa3-type cytochrome oxidase subunit CtaJ n=1 Tax=Micromonospora sp. NPDC049559 TaxID=3155923 RepID=UPI00343C3B81
MLIFVGIPAAVVLVITALALAGRGRGGAKRYRPGRPFDFTPVWFLSSPGQLAETTGVALPPGGQAPALTNGAIEKAEGARVPAAATGGASDRW